MAEPGDPQHPDDHDDHVGFSSAASLQGRPRDVTPEPEPEPEPAPEPEPVSAPEPRAVRAREPEPDLFDPPPVRPAIVAPEPMEAAPLTAAPATPGPERRPASADSIFEPSPEFTGRSRQRGAPVQDPPGGGMGLYAVYALILLAVPTLGLSAVIALLAVTGRPGPEDAMSRSHFIYQQRTLWSAAVAAGAGVILLAAPFALGVPLLFLAALWVVLRGATGVWNLKSGRAISNPRSWWI